MSRVALIGENSIEYINVLLDIWNRGDSAVLIDWRIPLHKSVEMMEAANIYECYIEKKILDKMEFNVVQDVAFLTFERKDSFAQCLPTSFYDKFEENYSYDEALVIFSSGTTGKAKGIILSHYAINRNADAIINYMKPNADDCMYIAKALSHSSTLIGELLVALKTRTKLVVAPTIVPPRYVLDSIKRFRVTIICLNPTLLSMIVDEFKRCVYTINSLKKIYVSGSILGDRIYKEAHSVFGTIAIYNVYGLSEAGPRVTAQREVCCKSNSVGMVIDGVAIAIVNELGELVEKGEKGIIHVNTTSKYDGYIFGKEKNVSLYKDWINTGDVGYEDMYGELHVIGRVDDVIIINSHKIYPGDIERQIVKSTQILECVVVKVELDNSEIIACLYVGDENKERDIYKKLQEQLPSYEIPRFFLKSDKIPCTYNGKVSRVDVQMKILKSIKKRYRNGWKHDD